MLKWLERAMPYIEVHPKNPLFAREVSNIRWGESVARLQAYTLKVGVVIQLFAISLWLFYTLSRQGMYSTFRPTVEYVAWLLLFNVAISIVLDIVCLTSGFNSLSDILASQFGHLLQIAPMREDSVLNARRALLQIRIWRLMAVLAALRFSVIVILFIHLFLEGWWIILITDVTFTFFVIEPLWRMRALTSVGQAAAIRGHNRLHFIFVASAIILVLEIIHYSATVWVIEWWRNIHDDFELGLVLMCIVPFLLIAFGGVTFLGWNRLDAWAMNHIRKNFFQSN